MTDSPRNQELLAELSSLNKKVQELEQSELERNGAERNQYLATKILGILNDSSTLTDSINLILAAIKQETGFDAVGIRLRSGDDFPYFVQNGFSHDFLLTENSLIARDEIGGPCRDENGNISLECTCGLVISGKTDPTNPLFTEAGSSWTNNSLPFLDLLAEQDPRFRPRNNCIHQGYLSVALIPISTNQEILGLLQLNDRRKDCFTLDMIHFFEEIGASIGIALMRKQTAEALQESEERYHSLFENMLDGFAYCGMLHDEEDRPIDFVYLDVNTAFEQLTGLKDVVGKKVTEVIPRVKELNPELLEIYGRVALTGQPEKFEIDFKPLAKWLSISVYSTSKGYFVAVFDDITKRKEAEEALEEERKRLQQALDEVRTLRGIVPICASCKKIRDDKGFWNQVEKYVSDRTEAEFTHGICPDCAKELYPEFYGDK